MIVKSHKMLPLLRAGAIVLAVGAMVRPIWAMEHLTLERDGRTEHVSGKVLVEARDGGLLLLARDGAMHAAQPEQMVRRESDETPFKPLTKEEIAAQLLAEMPNGFRIHQTSHYVICYNTSEAYAQWCGGLHERLYRGFHGFWMKRGLELKPPEFPLVALVFNNQASYASYARKEVGDAARSIIGYYNMETNRVIMYDLTGVDALRKYQRRTSSGAHINRILTQPAAERTVATIVHEATHQLAYNSGLQTRFAPNPFWVSEGIALFFETPDFRSSKGWRNIGSVNRVHLARFRTLLSQAPAGMLKSLLSDDAPFRDPKTAPDAYANAWALNYYLLKVRRNDYVDYLRDSARMRPLEELSAGERVRKFKQFFGPDPKKLEQDFLRYMRKVR